MTALTTFPFLTVSGASGFDSFTEQVMTSPIRPKSPVEPPCTLMHASRRAPELSATSRIVPIWIMTPSSPACPPALAGRQRTGLLDLNRVAGLRLENAVVRQEACRLLLVAAVTLVLDGTRDLDDHGLFHLVRDDGPDLTGAPPLIGRGRRAGLRLGNRGAAHGRAHCFLLRTTSS